MTTEAAWFSFEESSRGRIEEGYSADFAALTADYFTVPAHDIHSIGAEMTVVGGKVVWSTDRFATTEENA
jgi:predicted amidohydrolase YtcJ